MNSNTSNIIAIDIPKYKDKDPPIAPVKDVSCLKEECIGHLKTFQSE